MIMKANKQIGFIYKDNESIDKILKDGDVVFERGFLREKTSTTLPIAFGGVGKDLKDYKVYGNTVQNGTPTPDTSIDMVSCGDRTKNLIPTNIKDWEQGTISQSGTNQESTTRIRTIDYYKINNDTDYYVSIENENYTFLNIMLYDYQKQFIGQYHTINQEINGTRGLKINIASLSIPNVKYCRVILRRSNASTIIPEETSIIKPMIALGDTKLNFEPYGYKIPINVRSENLFDKDNANVYGGYISAGGVVSGSGDPSNYDIIVYIECNPNTTYALKKMLQSDTENNRFRIGCTSEIPTRSMQTTNFFKYNDGTTETQYIYTTSSTAKYLLFYCGRNSDTTSKQQILDSIVIVESSTVPSKYIPYYNETTNIYLDEPLRKIDEYSDYIDFINSKVVRNIGEVILDGTTNALSYYGTYGTYNAPLFYINKSDLILPSRYNETILIASHYRQYLVDSDNAFDMFNYGIRGALSNHRIYIRDDRYNSANNINTWLSSNNVIVDYVLETPTEEAITLPNIPTVEGNNTLNIETEITPSQVYIKYKSNS